MLPKRRARFVKPQRSNAGMVLPEFVIYAALDPMQQELAKGKYGEGSRMEPVIKEITNLSQELVDNCFDALRQTPPRVQLAFPHSREQLPCITIMSETMTSEGESLEHSGGYKDEDYTEYDSTTVLTPAGGAVGGETTFRLPHGNVLTRTVSLTITRGGSELPLYNNGAYDGFTVTSDTGQVVLEDPLVAGDILTAAEFYYYDLAGGAIFSTTYRFSHVVFIDTLNPLLTAVLTAIVWRELRIRHEAMTASGLDSVSIDRRSLSLWDQVEAPQGHRSELVVSGFTEWSSFLAEAALRDIHVDIDTTEGEESILLMQAELASMGESQFDNE